MSRQLEVMIKLDGSGDVLITSDGTEFGTKIVVGETFLSPSSDIYRHLRGLIGATERWKKSLDAVSKISQVPDRQ
ncbi:MAG: hypothetical protein ABI977_22055 [Acidobacteriota bacterium]